MDYQVRYENHINAGTASVHVVGLGTYSGEKTLNFTIQKAEQNIDIHKDTIRLYKREQLILNVRGAGSIHITSDNPQLLEATEDAVILTAKDVGTTAITLTFDGDANYEPATFVIPVEIRYLNRFVIQSVVVSDWSIAVDFLNDSDYGGELIVAAYDASERFLSATFIEINQSGTAQTELKTDGAKKVVVFTVDDLESVKPVGEKYIKQLLDIG